MLTPSKRIKLITEIARRLAREEWSLVDLTLDQYRLPTTDTWTGEKDAYVIQMISGADDVVLADLAHHVGVEVSNPNVGVDPPFWKDSHLRVFLSHLSGHRAYAASLQAALETLGISTFVAHNDIEPTAEWENEILTALSTCEVLIALLHAGFGNSNWTDQEIGFAMGRGIPVFSVRFDQDPYGFIGRFQAFNGNGREVDSIAREIFDVLRNHKQTQRRMAEVLVERFETSHSFKNAKENIALLEALDTWEPGFSERIRKAVETNTQISESWGVPKRVDTLIKGWKSRGV